MARSRSKFKGRAESGTFTALPHTLMDSDEFRGLSPSGLRVLLWLCRQYNGRNNGDLSATITQGIKFGVNSSASLAKALKELQELNLIICTRQGQFMQPGSRCALYAITWRAIDECIGKDLELGPTETSIRRFEKNHNPTQLMNKVRFKK